VYLKKWGRGEGGGRLYVYDELFFPRTDRYGGGDGGGCDAFIRTSWWPTWTPSWPLRRSAATRAWTDHSGGPKIYPTAWPDPCKHTQTHTHTHTHAMNKTYTPTPLDSDANHCRVPFFFYGFVEILL